MKNMDHKAWIENNVGKGFWDSYGNCEKITEKMKEIFPELNRIRGHYYCPIWGKRAHWWLETSCGEIIDPTRKQFPSKGIVGEYVPLDESKPHPTGICQNCGEYIYDYSYFCNDCKGSPQE